MESLFQGQTNSVFLKDNDAGDYMPNSTFLSDKVINPQFAQIFTNHIQPHGDFKAFVRFAAPEKKPDYMKVVELHSPGLFKVSLPCTQLNEAADDENILSIELCEHST